MNSMNVSVELEQNLLKKNKYLILMRACCICELFSFWRSKTKIFEKQVLPNHKKNLKKNTHDGVVNKNNIG